MIMSEPKEPDNSAVKKEKVSNEEDASSIHKSKKSKKKQKLLKDKATSEIEDYDEESKTKVNDDGILNKKEDDDKPCNTEAAALTDEKKNVNEDFEITEEEQSKQKDSSVNGAGTSKEIDAKSANIQSGNKEEQTEIDVSKSKNTSDEKYSKENETLKPDLESIEESEDEGIIDDLSDDMDCTARDALYEKALKYEEKNKKRAALKCFLHCMKGLNDVTKFSFLPQTLRKVADIYFELEELEKAIQFIQAEKMYYETALIDTSELQKKLIDRQNVHKYANEAQSETVDPKAATPEIVRADEYEKLARVCLDQKQPHLALEYQGKATKIRQHMYGDHHHVTMQSLDFFTVIYGEVGKQQYAESMEKMQKGDDVENKPVANKDGEKDLKNSPTSILRRRKKSEEASKISEQEKEEKKKVRFMEAQQRREEEEWISHTILVAMFVVCLLILFGIVSYLYCKVDKQSSLCSYWRTELWYYYMRLKYMYYSGQADKIVG